MEHLVQWLHVTRDGHIYTANPFGQIDLRDLSGKLLYQWLNIKTRGITSVTNNKREFIAIVVSGVNESGTAIKLKPKQSRSQTSDSWNITAYESPLESDIQTPLARLQNGCIAIGLKQHLQNDESIAQVHVLQCDNIPFNCLHRINTECQNIRSMCGLLGDTGEQLLACVTEFDGVKRPVVVYRVTSQEKVWQFSGQNVEEFKTRDVLDKVKEELKHNSVNQLSAAIHSLSPGLQYRSQTHHGPFSFPLDTSGLPLSSSFMRSLTQNPLKERLPILTDVYFRFLATDLCAIDEHKIFIAEAENREVLLVDNNGKIMDRVLTKEELGTLAIDHMQCILPSQYLITICTPRPIKDIGDQTLTVWRFKIKW